MSPTDQAWKTVPCDDLLRLGFLLLPCPHSASLVHSDGRNKPMVKISPSWAPRRRRGATFYFAKLVYNSWLTWFMDVCGMFYHVSYLSLRYLGGEQKQLRYNMIKLGRHRNQHVWFLIVRRNGKHFRLELVFLWSPWFDFTTDLRILGNCQCPSKHQWFDL